MEKSFIVDAGCIISPAFCAKSVSPRVSDATMTPNRPLRIRVEIIPDRSVVSAASPIGDVHASGRDGGRAARARAPRRCVAPVASSGPWRVSASGSTPAPRAARCEARERRFDRVARGGEHDDRESEGVRRAACARDRSGGASRRGGGNSRSRQGRGAAGDRARSMGPNELSTNGTRRRHTLRMIPRRCSRSRTPYQNATNASAKASDAFSGESHEAKSVR